MKWVPKASLGGVLNIFIFSALTLGGAFLFHSSLASKKNHSEEEIGHFIDKAGTVTVKTGRNKGWLPAQISNPVYNKTSIYTEAESSAAVQVRNTVIQIDEKTLLQVIDPDKRTELNMGFGGLRLSAKQKEEVILNVGGEQIKVSLDASTVKIKREKKSHTLKIESVSGPVKVQSKSLAEYVVPDGKALDLNVSAVNTLAEETPPPLPEKPRLKLNFQSEYSQDNMFSRRPTLRLAVLSDVREAKFEFSQDGNSWTQLEGAHFSPDREGEYLVRARGIFADGLEVASEPAPWTPKAEHFQLRQPHLRKSVFAVDPTKSLTRRNLFADFPNAPRTVEFKLQSSRLVKQQTPDILPPEEVPPSVKSMRVAASTALPYSFDSDWRDLQIKVTKPKISIKDGIVVLKPILFEQYYYEVGVAGGDQSLTVNKRNEVDPACDSDCKVSVRYKNHLDPEWSSEATSITVKGRAPMLRALAATEPQPLAVEKLNVSPLKFSTTAPWVFEFGMGGNYLSMTTESSLTNATTNGFSGPSLFVSGERQLQDVNLKASYLGIFTKMKSVSSSGSSSQNLAWQSVWAGVDHKGPWLFKRIEYGATYQQMPLFFQNASGAGQFQNANTLAVTVGFNTFFNVGESGRLVWDQRLLLPLASQGGGAVSSFSPRFGVEGDVSYYHCLKNQWALGGSWLGQYMNAGFSLREEPGLKAESPSTSMFNSNFQIRLQYGLCGTQLN